MRSALPLRPVSVSSGRDIFLNAVAGGSDCEADTRVGAVCRRRRGTCHVTWWTSSNFASDAGAGSSLSRRIFHWDAFELVLHYGGKNWSVAHPFIFCWQEIGREIRQSIEKAAQFLIHFWQYCHACIQLSNSKYKL